MYVAAGTLEHTAAYAILALTCCVLLLLALIDFFR